MGLKSCNEGAVSLSLGDPIISTLSENHRDELSALDANQDGAVSFDEAKGATLATPQGESEIEIIRPDDLRFYQTLINSANGTRTYSRFAETASQQLDRGHIYTSEAWACEIRESLQEGLLYKTQGNENDPVYTELCDVRETKDGYYFLINVQDNAQDENSFYFTIKFPKSPQAAFTAEVAGSAFNLSSIMNSQNASSVRLANRIFNNSLVLLQSPIPGLSDSEQANLLQRLEALYFQSNIMNVTDEDVATPPRQSAENTSLAARKTRCENSRMPLRGHLILSGHIINYDLPLYSEVSLTAVESNNIEAILQSLPPNLYDALAKNGVLPPLSFEVLEDDVMTYSAGPNTIGYCDRSRKKFFIRRSALAFNTISLSETCLHELCHAIFSLHPDDYSRVNQLLNNLQFGDPLPLETSSKYLIADLFAETCKRARSSPYFPAVSLYSLTNPAEFFADCSVAYLNGETDPRVQLDPIHGPKSRAELREKLPEMYVLLKLFYEPDSPFFGNKDLFNKENLSIVQFLVTSDLAKSALATSTSAADVAKDFRSAWGLLKKEACPL